MKPHHAVQRLSVIATLALCACAAAPKSPAGALRTASNDVANAEDARAADYAAVEMRSAHEKLNAARVLARQVTPDKDDPRRLQVLWLAEEASADADLAVAKARNVRTSSVVRAMQGDTSPPPTTLPPPAQVTVPLPAPVPEAVPVPVPAAATPETLPAPEPAPVAEPASPPMPGSAPVVPLPPPAEAAPTAPSSNGG